MRLASLAIALAAALAAAPAARAGVVALPSSATIGSSGPVRGGSAEIRINAAIGEREGAWIVATGAKTVAATADAAGLGALKVEIDWGHYVRFDRRLVPDALLPWDGKARPVEAPNQPLFVRVTVPDDAAAGSYSGSITVYADGEPTAVPIAVRVFPVRIPPPGQRRGSLQTSFHVSAQTFLSKSNALYGYASNTERRDANRALYAFLADYRVSPSSWGFGEPKSREGYRGSRKWWLDAAGNMVREVDAGPFSAMRLPVSSNRTAAGNRLAGLDPRAPRTWCDYLKRVREFWQSHGWLDGATLPFLYAYDEPGPAELANVVAEQAKVTHACFPGAHVLVTASPTDGNRFAWDRRGGDDVDIWAVLSRRYYGRFTVPAKQQTANRARESADAIDAARRKGKTIWSYTYSGVAGTPGFAASEPLSNARMIFLWNALEGIDGLLYGQGTTSYRAGNPLESVDRLGEYVLIYPGPGGPVPSARLEQIRDGIEDWAILDAVRRKKGAGAVRSILGRNGLFSADAGGVDLACNLGCRLKSGTTYSWPLWSHDATTPARIEQAKLQALTAAG